jgi:hypothetical protein
MKEGSQGENVSWWRNAMSSLLVVRCGAETEPVAGGRVSEAKWEKRGAQILRPSQELPGRLHAQGVAMAGQAGRSAAARANERTWRSGADSWCLGQEGAGAGQGGGGDDSSQSVSDAL